MGMILASLSAGINQISAIRKDKKIPLLKNFSKGKKLEN